MIELILIATPDELKLVEQYVNKTGRTPNRRIIITGVGGVNVFQSLNDIQRNYPIVNLGYAGSPNHQIGETVKIDASVLYHPNAEYNENSFILGDGGNICYTSSDFVTDKVESGIYDMELAFICAMGFTNVTSYKTISDNMSYEQYENTVQK